MSKDDTKQSELLPMTPWYEWKNNTATWWYNDRGLRLCVANIVVLFLGCYSNGYDGVLMNGLQVLPHWQARFHSSADGLGLIVASYFFPSLIAPVIFQFLSDKYGRRPVVILGALLGILGSFLGAFGNSVGTFIGGRVIVGASSSCVLVVIPPLIAEISHPRFRATATASFSNIFFVGSAVAGWVNFGVTYFDSDWSWRISVLLQALGCFPVLLWALSPLMVESPRWLVANGQDQKAHETLARMHANGDLNDELVMNELREIREMLVIQPDSSMWSKYHAFVETRGNRLRLAICVFLGFITTMAGNGILASYLGQVLVMCGVTDTLQIQGIVCALMMVLLFVSMVAVQYVERFGRRRMYLVCMCVMIAAMSMQIAFIAVTPTKPDVGKAAIASIFIFMVAYAVSLNPLWLLYLTEILPFELRTTGIAISSIVFSAGNVFGNYVTPIAFAHIGWKYYFVYLGINVAALFLLFVLIKETKGRTLEEIGEIFDGPGLGPHRFEEGMRSVEKMEADEVEHREN